MRAALELNLASPLNPGEYPETKENPEKSPVVRAGVTGKNPYQSGANYDEIPQTPKENPFQTPDQFANQKLSEFVRLVMKEIGLVGLQEAFPIAGHHSAFPKAAIKRLDGVDGKASADANRNRPQNRN